MSISQKFSPPNASKITSYSDGSRSKKNADSFQKDREILDQITLTRSVALQMSLRVMAIVAAPSSKDRDVSIEEFNAYQEKYLKTLGLLFGKENILDLPQDKLDWIRQIASQDGELRQRVLSCGERIKSLGTRLAEGNIPTYREASQFYEAIFPATYESMNVITEALWGDLELKKGDIDGARQTLTSAFNDIRKISTSIRLTAINASVEAARAGDAGRGFSVIASEVKTHAEGIQAATDNAQSVISTLIN
ncbi:MULTISPECIES: methyl-accepting chemotaxis protein [Falsihalocynthiibacter]|uniref:methyl-accepting chemotaxis protein n=1 Tax=Falsihalocynthiibacter TaxID=2854182 RepID=UPI0030039D79